MCGLFMPGRSFTGLIPGAQPGAASRSYQVWGLADERARAQATRRFLDKVRARHFDSGCACVVVCALCCQ